jgi:DNA repair exonuclease SbcCD ATPase subunit
MVKFKKIRYKNLLSVGNYFVEFDLDKYKNTVLVGKNGAAKSTLLVAVYYALFGKAFRKVKLNKLINSINNKHLVVELGFETRGFEYYIRRGMKPDIFQVFCNGEEIEQEASKKDFQDYFERTILGFNAKTFSQVVVLGSSSHTPFMELDAKERRAVIETLLDLEIFSGMNKIAKTKLDETKKDIIGLDNEIDILTQNKSNVEKYIQKLKNDNSSKISEIKNQIINHKKECDVLEEEIVKINKEKDLIEYNKIVDIKKRAKEKISKNQYELGSLEGDLRNIKKQIDFFVNNTSCPTCKSIIDEDKKKLYIEDFNDSVVNIKKSIDSLSEENDKLNAYINKADKKIKEYQSKEEEIRNLNYKKGILESTINSLNNSINNLVESKDSKAEEENANNIEREIESKNDIRKSLLKRKNLLETSVLFLKDTGIKAKVISQYIDIINETINNYMHKLNLFVRFELNENFEESIKSRHIDSFEYQSFSSGERHKIDLSILFMFIDIASRKNNVQTNLLLLDEILDSSLDTEAKQLALKLIKNSKDKNTIIITHSDEIIESLNGSSDILIRAEKKGNFSYYTKIN